MQLEKVHTWRGRLSAVRRRRARVGALLGVLALAAGCVSPAARPRFDFFAESTEAGDVWADKVAEWQARARPTADDLIPLDSRGGAPAERTGKLKVKMAVFETEQKRALAGRIAAFSQEQARRHFRFDASREPEHDHWPTVDELIERNGDDCDGLDLIAHQLLLELGFAPARVFRLIARRDRDGENHMVTLWFEDPEDPWVLDATGAMTLGMRRFSEIEGWTPSRMFNANRQYGVRPGRLGLAAGGP